MQIFASDATKNKNPCQFIKVFMPISKALAYDFLDCKNDSYYISARFQARKTCFLNLKAAIYLDLRIRE